MEETAETDLVPRNYQEALLEKCMQQNSIIFLPTGSGKTFIAILALKKMSKVLFGENHKVSIILVNNVALVGQHVKNVQQHTIFKCSGYSGEMNVDFWNAQKWHKEFVDNQVMVMTSEILANILRSSVITLSVINLLVFDECHHAVHDHSMRQIMMNFQNLPDPPKVIGLTATLLNGNCKPKNVMKEVRSLEITFHSKVATVEGLEVVVGHATNPKEMIVVYKDHILSSIEMECLDQVDYLMSTIDQIELPDYETGAHLKNPNLKPLEPSVGLKNISNLLKDLRMHLGVLGVYGGQIACISHKIQIERLKRHCGNAIFGYVLNFIETILDYIIQRYKEHMSSCLTEKERFFKFSSPKLLTLIETFDNFKRTSKENLCGLIFVERRFTAKIVYHILDSLRKADSNYFYINPDFIVGSNRNLFSETFEALYFSKKSKEVLNRFVSRETNILCTSQVLEEGIDLEMCTFVCKFDPPKDYRSYIQSKGRARHKLSHFYMLVEEKFESKFRSNYQNYLDVECTLNTFLIGKSDERDGPSKDDLEEMYNNDSIAPYYTKGPGSAYVNLLSAIPLLCRYCQSFSSDPYTSYNPEWYIDHDGVVQIYLPILCPLMEPIKGIPMPNKKLAKRAAAYVACIKLHKCGELDDSLMPVKRTVKEQDVSYLFEHHLKEKEKNVGNNKIRVYDIQISSALKGRIKANQNIYLHVINLKLLFSDTGDFNSTILNNMYNSDLRYGFLTPNKLPTLFEQPIFISQGTVMVNIMNNVETIQLSEKTLLNILKFHFTVFNDVLDMLNPFLISDLTEQSESLLVVPVNNSFKIDYSLLNSDIDINTRENELIHNEKTNLKVKNENYLHKIVIPYYRQDVQPYLVTRIHFDKTPESSFPNDNYKNFCKYYEEKHNVKIVNRTQPLVEVTTWSRRLNLYKPPGIQKKREREKKYEKVEYLIPEMLVKQEFPAQLWIQARFLPTILSRLTYTLRVYDLWKKIGNECDFFLNTSNTMSPLKLNMNLINYETSINEEEEQLKNIKYHQKSESIFAALPESSKPSLCNRDFQSKILESQYPWKDLDEPIDIERNLDVSILDIEAYENFINKKVMNNDGSFIHKDVMSPKKNYPALTYDREFVVNHIRIIEEENKGSVELADLYEAMTTAKANDIVNLERLETLGDSFLKYITSYYIVLKFPKYDEGQATQLKGRMVSNKNLFYLAQKINIGGIMKNRDLNAKEEWLPPGFCVPETISKAIKTNTASVNCLFFCDFTREQRIFGDMSKVSMNEIISSVEVEKDNIYVNMEQFLKQQFLKDKCVADVVEAILGTYLEKTGIKGCLKVLQWIGVIPSSENLEVFLKQPPPNPLLNPKAKISDIEYHQPFIGEIEKRIGYVFKNKGYILQAFTHASYSPNRLTHSYEKLEFLGDAILDFLITCHIYESCGYLTPGEVTDLRSALVNNNTFGSYVVKLGLHKFILLMNEKLQIYIDKFSQYMALKDFEISDEVLILLQEGELNLAEYVDVPKALGDIFEAIAGAIFLDSGYKLDVVWKVFYKIMWKEIDLFSTNVPKNVVRKLYECPGACPVFGETQKTSNGRIMMKLQFFSEGRPKFVHGFGSNKMDAKKAAAKMALRYL